jgi:hypothetical protein
MNCYLITIRVAYSLSSNTYYTKIFNTDKTGVKLGDELKQIVRDILVEHDDTAFENSTSILLFEKL